MSREVCRHLLFVYNSKMICMKEALLSRINDVLEYAIGNIQRIDPESDLWNESLGPSIAFSDKVVAETCLLALVVHRFAGKRKEFNDKLLALGARLSPYIRNDHNRMLLLRNPEAAMVFGLGHAALDAIGIPDEQFGFLIRRQFVSSEIFNAERIPYRKLDLIWLHNLLCKQQELAFNEVLPHSILKSDSHPIYMSSYDTYALTHGLMYITDFGRRDPSGLIDIEHVAAVIEACIAFHLLSDNLDLLGELIMAYAMTRRPWTPYVHLAWRFFTATWDRLGFLPCPTFDSKVFTSLQPEERPPYAFKHTYHTTFVGSILCCVLGETFAPGGSPEEGNSPLLPTSTLEEIASTVVECIGLAEQFLIVRTGRKWEDLVSGYGLFPAKWSHETVIDYLAGIMEECFGGRGTAQWLVSYIMEPRNHADPKLKTIVLDALLIHAVRDYNLMLVVNLLSLIADQDLRLTITIVKAVEFLCRQQLACGAIGAYFVKKENIERQEAVSMTVAVAGCLKAICKTGKHPILLTTWSD